MYLCDISLKSNNEKQRRYYIAHILIVVKKTKIILYWLLSKKMFRHNVTFYLNLTKNTDVYNKFWRVYEVE